MTKGPLQFIEDLAADAVTLVPGEETALRIHADFRSDPFALWFASSPVHGLYLGPWHDDLGPFDASVCAAVHPDPALRDRLRRALGAFYEAYASKRQLDCMTVSVYADGSYSLGMTERK
jgi:hypothetical protein